MRYESRRVMFSSKHGYHRTPLDLFQQLDEEFHFTLDVCTEPDNRLSKDIWFFSGDSGLYHSWFGNTCFMNPPYQRGILKQWLAKAEHERKHFNVMTVALLPCRTSEKWFWDFCIDKEIRLIKGRIKFSGMSTGAPFPSCIVIFRP